MRRDEEGKGKERVWRVEGEGGGFVTRTKNADAGAGADAGIRYQESESDETFSTSSPGLLVLGLAGLSHGP